MNKINRPPHLSLDPIQSKKNSNEENPLENNFNENSVKIPSSLLNLVSKNKEKEGSSVFDFYPNLALNQFFPDQIKKSVEFVKPSSNYLHSTKNIKSFNRLNTKTEKKIKFYDVITNIYLIKKFISILMRISLVMKPKFLNNYHFSIINDKSFFYNNLFQSENKYDMLKSLKSVPKFRHGLNIFQLLLHQIDHIKIFNPFNYFLIGMNLINLFLYFFFVFFVPISFCFCLNMEEENFGISISTYYLMILLVILFYFLDILINFNKAYYLKGELVLNRKMITYNYLKNYFVFDALSIICFSPIILNYSKFSLNYSNLLFLIYIILKTKKIINIIKQIEELFIVDQTYFNIYELIKLFTRIIIIAHFAACIWYVITLDDFSEKNWIKSINIINSDWKIKYLYSFYYIIITMNTVGYGDLTPQNPKEVIFSIVFVFLACSLFAYCINCVGNIFKEIYQRESGYRADLFSINEFMRNKKVNKNLQIRIRKYLEYIWKEEKIQNIEFSKNVISKLSSSLQSDLMLEANGPIIENLDMFSKNFSAKSLRSLIDIMTEERFTPGEIIFNEGNSDNFDMFIIKKGKVEIFVENPLNENKKKLIQLDEGKTFGEISFFSELARTASVRSTDFTTLIRINQKKFRKNIKDCLDDHEKFNNIKDSIRLYSKYDDIFIKCYSCNKSNHLITNCPLLHRNFLHEIIISKYNYSIFQERNYKIRRKKKINSLIYKKILSVKPFKSISHQTESIIDDDYEEIKSPTFLENKENDESKIFRENKSIEIESLFNLKNEDDKKEEKSSFKFKLNSQHSLIIIKNEDSENYYQSDKNLINEDDYNKNNLQENEEIKIKKNSINLNPKLKSGEINKYNETNNVNQEKDIQFELYFDLMKIYKNYFPYNNVDEILNTININTFQKLKKKKKSYLFLNKSNSKTKFKPFFDSQITINFGNKRKQLKKNSEKIKNYKDIKKRLKNIEEKSLKTNFVQRLWFKIKFFFMISKKI